MSGKAILIVVLGFMSISFVTYESVIWNSNSTSENIGKYFYEQQAYNIAQTGINMALIKLSDDPEWRTGYYYQNLFEGLLYVAVKDTLYDSLDVVKISSTGIMDYNTDTELRINSVAFLKATSIEVPSTIKAAITSNSDVESDGNLIIDGRDHDISGNVIAGEGSHAVWTTGKYDRKGNSLIGSSYNGKDYEPSKSKSNKIVLDKQEWTETESDETEESEESDDEKDKKGKKDKEDKKDKKDKKDKDDKSDDYPDTPEEALGGSENGFTSGILKEIAKSGADGSQYVTDPKDLLEQDFSGITYIDLSGKDKWENVDISGSGILIVHNNNNDAEISNLATGTFKGIIIADKIEKVNTDIIGAVFALDSDAKKSIGKGDGRILYSSEAIEDAISKYSSQTSNSANTENGVLAWWN